MTTTVWVLLCVCLINKFLAEQERTRETALIAVFFSVQFQISFKHKETKPN